MGYESLQMFVLQIISYEDKSFQGHCYKCSMEKGNYPDLQKWLGLSKSVRSCHVILQMSPSAWHCITVGEISFGLPFKDIPQATSIFEIHSLNILDGSWISYEMPSFREQQYLLKPREHRRLLDWGAVNIKVGF
uniref:Beta/gamma crystallin 'Greek key' domain-containing protein n=1 Tax=Dromaius novaehollandiae TaxID=8790 RepID=A0A8C4KIZ3_DRONO